MTKSSINKLYLRFHARIILGIVVLSGFASSHLMLKHTGLELWQRYPVAALFSYLMFLALMYFWKHYLEGLPPIHPEKNSKSKNVSIDRSERTWRDYLDIPDFTTDIDDFIIAIGALILFFLLIYFASFLLFELPVLMIEIVLSSVVSSILYRPIQTADKDIFVFKVLRNTFWYGFTLVLIYLAIGMLIQASCPLAQKFADIFNGSCG